MTFLPLRSPLLRFLHRPNLTLYSSSRSIDVYIIVEILAAIFRCLLAEVLLVIVIDLKCFSCPLESQCGIDGSVDGLLH